MSLLTDKAIEVDRCNIIIMGNTPYVMIPRFLRRETEPKSGDEVLFFRTSQTDDGESIIRIEKQTPKTNGTGNPS